MIPTKSARGLDEEARLLLRKIVESLAYRQLMAINIDGHCLKVLGELEAKIAVAELLAHELKLFREVQALYAELGFTDVESAVRDKMERIPYPTSRMEYGISRYLCSLAEQVAMRAYTASACGELAAIARSQLEPPPAGPLNEPAGPLNEEERFAHYCSEPGNRPHAQQLLNRWLAIALRSLGRPGTRGDARAQALGLRSLGCGAVIRAFLAELDPLLERCGLALPDLAELGLELPPEPPAAQGAQGARRARG